MSYKQTTILQTTTKTLLVTNITRWGSLTKEVLGQENYHSMFLCTRFEIYHHLAAGYSQRVVVNFFCFCVIYVKILLSLLVTLQRFFNVISFLKKTTNTSNERAKNFLSAVLQLFISSVWLVSYKTLKLLINSQKSEYSTQTNVQLDQLFVIIFKVYNWKETAFEELYDKNCNF